MTKWKINGARVYGNGLSINCPNKITAISLFTTLTNYETTINSLQQQLQLEKHFQLIIMDLKVLKEDVEQLKGKIQ